MGQWSDKRFVVWCACNQHAIVIDANRYDGDDAGYTDVDLTMWGNESGTWKGSIPTLWWRLRWAWRAIRKGEAPTEWVAMDYNDVVALRDACAEIADGWGQRK